LGNKSIVFISLIFFCTAIFGIIEYASINQPFGFFENQNPFDIQEAEAAPSGLVATVNPDGTITLTWSADPSATSYRIFRTSTETADEVIEYSFAGTLNPQAIAINQSPRDFGVETTWPDARFRDEIVSRITINKIDGFGSPSGGDVQGVIVKNSVGLSTDDTIIANSTTKVDPSTLPELPEVFSGVARTFKFIGTDLVNLTTTNAPSTANLGFGVVWKGYDKDSHLLQYMQEYLGELMILQMMQ